MSAPGLNPDPRAVAIAVGIVAVALAVTGAYLVWQLVKANRLVERLTAQAEQAGDYEAEAQAWKTNYYTAAADREDLIRRNSQLASALDLSTELISHDRQVIAELELQFRETTPDQEA